MRFVIRRLAILTLFSGAVLSGAADAATVSAASCRTADVQNAVNGAVSGDTVLVPAGTCEWTTSVSISKYVILRGAGGGGYVGRSTTALSVSTGSKTFTTQAGLSFVAGETITARYPNFDGVNYMTGTVSSYNGTTLTLNITGIGGTGARPLWVFERPASTTIVNSGVSNWGQGLISITESTAGSIELSGIHFTTGTGSLGNHINISNGGSSAYPVLIHDNWFQETGKLNEAVANGVNRGVIYKNSFGATLCAATFLGCTVQVNGALGIILNTYASYASPSTLGTLDTTGTNNVYYEDNYFLAFWQAMTGFDDGARAVFRHNILDNSALGSHGADTSPIGARLWEVTDNIFYYDNLNPAGCEAYNLNYAFYIRGGTGVIANNTFADINSGQCYGDKSEILIAIQNLRRASTTNSCWGATASGIQYPSPRQFGFGYTTGKAGNDSTGQYFGDSEPAYIFNNGAAVIALQDYEPNDCGAGADPISGYVQLNRDYFTSAKPGYAGYPYPHPLRKAGTLFTAAPPAPTAVQIIK